MCEGLANTYFHFSYLYVSSTFVLSLDYLYSDTEIGTNI